MHECFWPFIFEWFEVLIYSREAGKFFGNCAQKLAAHLKILLQTTVIIHSFLKIHVAKERDSILHWQKDWHYTIANSFKTYQVGKVRFFSIFITRSKKAVLPETTNLEKASEPNPFPLLPPCLPSPIPAPSTKIYKKMSSPIAGNFAAKTALLIQADV